MHSFRPSQPPQSGRENETSNVALNIAPTLAAVLVAVAAFSLSSMVSVEKPENTKVDEILCCLGLFFMLVSAFVVDAVLDAGKITKSDRKKLLGGGYLFFCLSMAALSFVILVVYYIRENDLENVSPYYSGLFVVAGLAGAGLQAWKMMLLDEHGDDKQYILMLATLLGFAFFYGSAAGPERPIEQKNQGCEQPASVARAVTIIGTKSCAKPKIPFQTVPYRDGFAKVLAKETSFATNFCDEKIPENSAIGRKLQNS